MQLGGFRGRARDGDWSSCRASALSEQRRDGLHKLTTRLAKTHATVVVEDLNVAGMVRNRRLARSVADTGMREVRRQLGYKTVWYGSRLQVADRWYPSSKTCSSCGWRNPNLPLRKRIFGCEQCGLAIDRDHNASLNLKALADYDATGAGVAGHPDLERSNARGADRKTPHAGRVAVKREPRTVKTGQTGTVIRQRTAAIKELTHAS